MSTQTPFLENLAREAATADPAHDFSHCKRVLKNALEIAEIEGGDLEILTAAAYLHDIANLPKNHPDSKFSADRSAEQATEILTKIGMSAEKIILIRDAILGHSYSRGLIPQTHEGRVFQDADRLDALGAIGIARTFTVGGATGRCIYHLEDPFGETDRVLDDKDNTLDHFNIKLFTLVEKMQTATGKQKAQERVQTMRYFMSALQIEIL